MCSCQYAAFTHHPPLISPLLSSPFLSSPLLSSPLRPGWCTSHQTAKETKALSLSWSREELSVPSALFDDSISNDTLILTPHCLFFLYDEIPLERRATGRIIKTWLKRGEPHSSLETTHDNFVSRRCKEHDRVGGIGFVEMSRNYVFSLQITFHSGDTKAKKKLRPHYKEWRRINESNEAYLSKLSVASGLGWINHKFQP